MLYQSLLQDQEIPADRMFSCFSYDSISPVFPLHCHMHLEIIYQLAGILVLSLDGKDHLLEAGDMAFVPMLMPHSMNHIDDAPSRHIILQISPNYVSFGSQNADLFRRIQPGAALRKSGGFSCRLPEHSQAHRLFEQLGAECAYEGSGSIAVMARSLESKDSFAALCKANGLVFLLMSELLSMEILSASGEADSLININELNRISAVLHRMITQPELPLSMADAAQMANMSYANFSRTFVRVIGVHFVDYQNILRVRCAEDLLTSANDTITEIANRLNFGSTSYFNRVFKQFAGLTPTEHRRRLARR